jgi:hypothetical protein
VQCRRPLEDTDELVGVHGGQCLRREALDPEAVGQQAGRAEGALHGELLVEQHPDQQGERIPAEQLVGGVVLGDAELGHIGECAPARSRRG